MKGKLRVLFVCTHNSARSQMAEEYLRKYGGELFEAESAGFEPGTLNPYVVRALREDGIDIAGKSTKSVFDLWKRDTHYDYVITVCSAQAERDCPIFPGMVARRSWPFPDPSLFTGTEAEVMEQVREIRNRIGKQVRDFVAELVAGRGGSPVLRT